MRKIFKLFLIFLYFILFFGTNTCQANIILPNSYHNAIIQNVKNEKTTLSDFKMLNDTAIAASNNTFEISTCKTKQDNSIGIYENGISSSLVSEKFIKSHNYFFCSTSCNTKFNISNEILIRAP